MTTPPQVTRALPSVVDVSTMLITTPIIDWDYLLAKREAVIKHSDGLPAYLLLPEVRALITSIHNDNSRFLFTTLWYTGARISEALALTKDSFDLDGRDPYVSLRILKGRGRPKKATKKVSRDRARMVPIRDVAYIEIIKTYFGSYRLKRDERIFNLSRQSADLRLRKAIAQLDAAGRTLSIKISCHTFRHSFAVNCILHGTPLPVVQQWLGHANIQSTIVYTQVLTRETGHLMERVQF